MKGSELRNSFLDYFKSKNHEIVDSSSLIPENDPTILFANAGMNQFKNLFLGAETRRYSKAATSQKCLRISGKHNDLENVGVTARHHTFFEMLGNFSFGDYFKKEAIEYAWEYLTEVLKLSKDRLWITVFENDDEAERLWLAHVSKDRILRCGAKDNFWAMGDTGPCGPCSEIHYYLGSDLSAQSEYSFRNTDGLYLEIWNIVFMQFDGDISNPLPKPSIDTGMGLERLASVVQGVGSNYDTDLLRPIISKCEDLSGLKYDGRSFENPTAQDIAMRVIADHSRAASFLIGAGVLPGADGRSYVLRRIIRRAVRHGRNLGFNKPFLSKMAEVVIKNFGDSYPELKEQSAIIDRALRAEEEKFFETLDSGMALLKKEVEKLGASSVFPGDVAFMLHDTFGFPLDLTEDALKEYKKTVDVASFEASMKQQKERSRGEKKTFEAVSVAGEKTEFIGYNELEVETTVSHVASFSDKKVSLLFAKTPFYAESGGQVGDTGEAILEGCRIKIFDTQKTTEGYFIHHGEVIEGEFSPNQKKARLIVDSKRRASIARNHSTTHLIHAALRKFLGDHIKQAGSRVDQDSLRFDYSHFEPVSEKTLSEIFDYVNHQILSDIEVVTHVLPIEEAKKLGAIALFGEKYGSIVRVVQIGADSIEFCGGTHVSRTGEIGFSLIDSELGVSSGTRRIEALSGFAALNRYKELERVSKELSSLFKTSTNQIVERSKKLISQNTGLLKEISELKDKIAGSTNLEAKTSPQGRTVVASLVNAADLDSLKKLVDSTRVKIGSGIVVLGGVVDGVGAIVLGATSDQKLHLGNLVKEVTSNIGGKGGGRPDFAQAGGIPKEKLAEALDTFVSLM
jgi:alanyl-tRNA synthetase